MGCLWTAQLIKANIKPILLLRKSRFRALSLPLSSLIIEELDGTTHRLPIKLDSSESPTGPIKHLLVCTKAQDAEAAVHSVADKLSDPCQILLMQNGMGSQQAVAQHFSSHTVWAVSTTEAAWMKGFLHVCHGGQGLTWIGPMGHTPDESTWQGLKKSMDRLPFEVHFTHHIEQKLWDKLAVNCAINGLTALYNCNNGELLNIAESQERLSALTEEVIQVSHAAGMATSENLLEWVRQVCRDTAMNHSSTCMDARQGRTTELPFINGYLIEQADKLGIQAPANKELMRELAERNIH